MTIEKKSVPSVSVSYAQSGASTKANALGMRAMQERAYEKRGEQYLLIKSPPASGKSRALMFIALDNLANQGLRQAIIVVPEKSIGASFADEPLTKYGFWADWTVTPKWNLCNAPGEDGGKVNSVGAFLESDDKVLVCTHATFRFAVERFGVEAFDDRLIAVDEFHHVSASHGNKLGLHLADFIARDKAHIVAMTGSYFRGDAEAVLSPGDEAKFDSVTYTYYEQLNGYEWLKRLDIGYFFYSGAYADDILAVLDPDEKTIIHIPSVNSRESTKDKIKEVNHILDALGTWEGVDDATGFQLVKTAAGRTLRIADLVDDDANKRGRVLAALKDPAQKNNRDNVDIIIALGMAKEGFDWIWCEHALTVGYRASLTEIVQIIGRAKVFKFYSPKAEKSKVSLVAHRREVTDSALQIYIPEFGEEFFETESGQDLTKGRNFIIKAYVFGDYLNDNVSLERGEFRFQTDADLLNGISQTDIEQRAAEIAQVAVGSEIAERKKRKEARIAEYVEADAPWHRILAKEVDFSALPMKPSNQDIELHLQKKKYEKEVATRTQVAALLSSENPDELAEKIAQVIENISDSSKNDLIHYVSMRRCVIDLFSKSLEIGADGKHQSEGEVHDIIMPRRKDSEGLNYDAHNLWILDERLNFTSYVSSDKPLEAANSDRTDITVYNRRVAFRGDNEASNPITIFEFKRPQRDDFADPSSKEDPVQQIVRYVNQIREGKFKTPTGRDILVNGTTPFYGYVVCDLTAKVKRWLEFEQQFTPMPDGLGWFRWFGNISLYMEVISWTKLLRDAEMRNKIFFNKLGID